MGNNLIAMASITIKAPAAKVWQALVEPEAIKQYMFGTTVVSDLKVGGPIRWKGVWKGKAYEDKGTVLEIRPQQRLKYSHFSPLTGMPDKAENYHTVTVDLLQETEGTVVTLAQDNNATDEERRHSQENWMLMLEGLKKFVEG
jgi:uncharacterized protein YndB with AHSA1/START domain